MELCLHATVAKIAPEVRWTYHVQDIGQAVPSVTIDWQRIPASNETLFIYKYSKTT